MVALSIREQFALGDVIEAQYRGTEGGKWYPGKISAAYGDCTYDIAYDDGDKDSKLSAMFIRPRKGGGEAAEGSGGGGEVAAPSRAPEQEGMEGFEDLERRAREQEPEGEAPISDIAGYRI